MDRDPNAKISINDKMSDFSQDLSMIPPDASSYVDKFEDMEITEVKNNVKDVLKSRIFLGRYVERRLTDQRIGYRDVVVLSPAEVDLKRDLTEAQNKLLSVYPNNHWIGITDGSPIGYPNTICLWTEIDNQPFGPYWYQIRSVKFRNEEVIIQLKYIRYISDAYLELEPLLTGSARKPLTNIAKVVSQPAAATEALNDTYNELVTTLKSALSIRNLKEFCTFIAALVIAVFTGSNAFINFLGNFILALMRELSILVKNSTPMFLGLLDFFSKIVGGFYILVAMIFRPSPAPPSRNLHQYSRNQRSSIGYDSGYNSKDFD